MSSENDIERGDTPARGFHPNPPSPSHGDHWLAALEQDDPRLRDALAIPVDAPERLTLHRASLNEALDRVQVTRARRLVTAYPEPRATSLVRGVPRELHLWENRAEGWLTFEHPTGGTLTVFLTDLAEAAPRYAAAGTRAGIDLEIAGIAYRIDRSAARTAPRLAPAARTDPRFLPDDYSFDAEVVDVHAAGAGEVFDLAFQGDLAFPVAWREGSLIEPGRRAQGYLRLTGRLPEPAATRPTH